MKKINKATSGILCCLLSAILILSAFLPCFSLIASANEQYVFSLEEKRNIEISVLYSASKPTISIKGPGKASYSKNSDYANVEEAEGIINYYIKNAPAGSWTINSSTEIKYHVLKWNPQLDISSFSFSKNKDDTVTVKTKVSGKKDDHFHWDIYAVSDASVTGQPMKVLLGEKTGKTNTDCQETLSTQNLPDGTWYLTMEAYVNNNDGTESDSFSTADGELKISGHTKKGNNKEFLTTVDITQQTVSIDWSAVEESYDEMLVSVTDDAGVLIMYETFKPSDKSTRVVTDDAKSSVTVSLMPMRNNTFSVKYERKVPLSPSVTVNIDTLEATSSLMLSISYDAGKSTIPLEVTLNDNKTAYQIKGKSSLSIPLDTLENNEVVVEYTVSEGLRYRLSKEITVRSDPPSLTLFGINSKTVTNESKITIVGKTDPGATLKVNNQNIEVKADGNFSAEIKLSDGENPIEFVATSPYGVNTIQNIIVIRTNNKNYTGTVESTFEKYLPAIVSISFALIAILAFALIAKAGKKKGKKIPEIIYNEIQALIAMASAGFAAAAVLSGIKHSNVTAAITGENLIKLLKETEFEKINEGLDARQIWMSLLIKYAIIGGCLIIVFILSFILKKKLFKNNKNENVNESEEETGENIPPQE